MTAVGFVLFVLALIFEPGLREISSGARYLAMVAGLIGLMLIVAGIAVKLWGWMP